MAEHTTTQRLLFPDTFPTPGVAQFDRRQGSSDGGAILLRTANRCLRLTSSLAACLVDQRQPGKIRHELRELLTQRVMALACGYEDANDAERLASDPVHKLQVGRDPIEGEDLALQATLSRFENAPRRKPLFVEEITPMKRGLKYRPIVFHGELEGRWTLHDTRDQVMDFVRRWSPETGITVRTLVLWLGVATSKFYSWQMRYGKVSEHHGWVPRDFWLEAWEKQTIIEFHDRYPLEGCRRLTFMMLDQDVVAVSPASVWRVLHRAGRLGYWNRKASMKGRGFQAPLAPHEHWHVDISYVNLAGTFYHLCSVLDGYSRYLVHWELRESIKEMDVEIILARAREKFPQARRPVSAKSE